MGTPSSNHAVAAASCTTTSLTRRVCLVARLVLGLVLVFGFDGFLSSLPAVWAHSLQATVALGGALLRTTHVVPVVRALATNRYLGRSYRKLCQLLLVVGVVPGGTNG